MLGDHVPARSAITYDAALDSMRDRADYIALRRDFDNDFHGRLCEFGGWPVAPCAAAADSCSGEPLSVGTGSLLCGAGD
jgi:hypothetical protein